MLGGASWRWRLQLQAGVCEPPPHCLTIRSSKRLPACACCCSAASGCTLHRPALSVPSTLGVLLASASACSWLSRRLPLRRSRLSADDPHAAQAAAPPDHAIHPQPCQGTQWVGLASEQQGAGARGNGISGSNGRATAAPSR